MPRFAIGTPIQRKFYHRTYMYMGQTQVCGVFTDSSPHNAGIVCWATTKGRVFYDYWDLSVFMTCTKLPDYGRSLSRYLWFLSYVPKDP